LRNRPRSKKLRQKHQDELAAKPEAKGDKETARIIRRIQRAEQTKKLYQKCQQARGLNHQGGHSYLLVPENSQENPKTCSEWRRVECPNEIVALLQERNREHFGQSKDCNMTSDPFDFIVEFTGASLRAEKILNGTFTNDDELFPQLDDVHQNRIRELTKVFLEALQFVNTEVKDKIVSAITLEEYKGKIQKWDERTSTSPGSNMHLGHLKAYWARHNFAKDSDKEAELESI
jgi:hypothetical protein